MASVPIAFHNRRIIDYKWLKARLKSHCEHCDTQCCTALNSNYDGQLKRAESVCWNVNRIISLNPKKTKAERKRMLLEQTLDGEEL